MKKYHTIIMFLSTLSAAFFLPTVDIITNQTFDRFQKDSGSTSSAVKTINIDGDVSLSEARDRILWNPHAIGYTTTTTWNVTFNEEANLFLQTTTEEAGHVAIGAWWTTSFNPEKKLPLYAAKPIKLRASFRINVATVYYTANDEWLRIALACAVQRSDGSVVYTEMDFWDSPKTLRHPSGNIRFGGDVVYRGGDVVEYKIDQLIIGEWTNYSLDLTQFIDRAWSIKPGDLLESVYVVVETIGVSVELSMKIDDLWITQVE